MSIIINDNTLSQAEKDLYIEFFNNYKSTDYQNEVIEIDEFSFYKDINNQVEIAFDNLLDYNPITKKLYSTTAILQLLTNLNNEFAYETSIENEEEMDDMMEELIDRFGDVPRKVQQLLSIALLKALAHSVYVIAIEQKGDVFKFVMYEKAKVKVERIAPMIEDYKGNLKFTVDTNPYFTYKKLSKNKKEKDEDVLELVKNVLNSIKSLLD